MQRSRTLVEPSRSNQAALAEFYRAGGVSVQFRKHNRSGMVAALAIAQSKWDRERNTAVYVRQTGNFWLYESPDNQITTRSLN